MLARELGGYLGVRIVYNNRGKRLLLLFISLFVITPHSSRLGNVFLLIIDGLVFIRCNYNFGFFCT